MKTFPQSGFDELYNASIGATALPPPPPRRSDGRTAAPAHDVYLRTRLRSRFSFGELGRRETIDSRLAASKHKSYSRRPSHRRSSCRRLARSVGSPAFSSQVRACGDGARPTDALHATDIAVIGLFGHMGTRLRLGKNEMANGRIITRPAC